MPEQLVSDLDFAQQQKSNVVKAAAETLIRVLGGAHIYVRVPLVFAGAGDAAQLGKSGAASEDVELSPVVVLAKKGREKEVLVPAGALLRAKEIAEPLAAKQFFESALGMVVGTQLTRVVSVEWEEIGGEAFLYRVVLSS
jgi:hypothetical protein